MDRLTAALLYANCGFPVFPIHSVRDGKCTCGSACGRNAGKHPWTAHGFKDASTDADTIRTWWQKWPDANVAIATGKRSNLLVLDIDPREGGDTHLAGLQEEHGQLPRTLTSQTGGGGVHYFFCYEDGVRNSSGKIAPGIDVKSEGGYVLVPPSIHWSGNCYRWTEEWRQGHLEVVHAPDWLLSRARQEPSFYQPSKPASDNAETKSRIPGGKRNSTLASLAGSMQRRGMSRESIAAALILENRERCDPPLSDDEVRRIANSISRYDSQDSPREDPGNSAQDSARPKPGGEGHSQASLLVALADSARLFHTPAGDGYGAVPVNGHFENWLLRSKGFRSWLVRGFYQRHDRPPGSQALQDALNVLEAKARYDGSELPDFTRTAELNGAIYLDLCNPDWEAIEITEMGWRLVSDPPVRFRRSKGMLALPRPILDGLITELRPYINATDHKTWILIVAWLVAAMRPVGPYPLLILQGEAGSAKSTTSRLLRALVDPSAAPLRAAPREERDLMIAAGNSWVLNFDNLSTVPHWLADALCRLATGGGLSIRELYSDAEEVIFDASRPMILNGIEDLATREDLTDRAVMVTLPAIPNERRRPESEFWQSFNSAAPRILGALLTVLSGALRNFGTTQVSDSPRMADFVQWVTAAEEALGWSPGSFLEVYHENRSEGMAAALDADPVAVALRDFLADQSEWRGSATDLLSALRRRTEETVRKGRAWPSNARSLGNRVRRIAPLLRSSGVEVEFGKESRRRIIVLRIAPQNIVSNVSHVSGSENTGVDDETQTDAATKDIVSEGTFASPVTPSAVRDGDATDDGDAKLRHRSSRPVDGAPGTSATQTLDGDWECLGCGDLFGSWESWQVHLREGDCTGDRQ